MNYKTTDPVAASFRHHGTLRHFLSNVYHMCTQDLRIEALPSYSNVLDDQQKRWVAIILLNDLTENLLLWELQLDRRLNKHLGG